MDPIYFEPIEETPLQEQITLADSDDRTTLVVPIDSMMCLSKSASESANSPFETVIVCPETNESVVLDVEVWKRWLVRGNAAQEAFMAIFVDGIQVEAARAQFLTSIRANKDLFFRVCTFISDLKRYGSSALAAKRIDSISFDAPLKFGWPYFELDEANFLLGGPLHPKTTIKDALAKRIEGKSMEVCASHDMAPSLIRAFSIDEDEMERTGFRKFYEAFRGISTDGIGRGGQGNESGRSNGNERGGESSSRRGAEKAKPAKKGRNKARNGNGKQRRTEKEYGVSGETSIKGSSLGKKGK